MRLLNVHKRLLEPTSTPQLLYSTLCAPTRQIHLQGHVCWTATVSGPTAAGDLTPWRDVKERWDPPPPVMTLCTYTQRILSSLLLSCVLSMPGRAAATRRNSWREREPDVVRQRRKYTSYLNHDRSTGTHQESTVCTFPWHDLAYGSFDARTEEDSHRSFLQSWFEFSSMFMNHCTAGVSWIEGVTVPHWDLQSIKRGRLEVLDGSKWFLKTGTVLNAWWCSTCHTKEHNIGPDFRHMQQQLLMCDSVSGQRSFSH